MAHSSRLAAPLVRMPTPPPTRIASVDYGNRRVGLALTDPLALFAQPAGTYAPGEALMRLAALHAEHGLAAIVVGWPLEDDGSEGRAVDRVRPFVGRLKKLVPGVPIVQQDERDTSRRAVAALVEAGVPRGARRQKERVDAAAAVLILTDWLEDRQGGA